MNYQTLHEMIKMITNPSNDFSNQFEIQLNKEKPNKSEVETLYGTALDRGNNIAIALINFYVRENKIVIDKDNIPEQAYYAECRRVLKEANTPKHHVMISFADYGKVAP